MLTRLSDPQEIEDAYHRMTDPTRPVLVGMGPVEAATTMALEQWPSLVYDTNLFYRDMGVHFRATRAQIRRAYQEGGGPNDVRLTMIAGVLLNPQRRLAYDRVPLGKLFFDDEIEEALRIAAATAAGEAREQGDEVDEELLNRELEAMRELPEYLEELPSYAERYLWSYYVFRDPDVDTERLDLWRGAIISALWQIFRFDRPPTLAVGYFRQEPGEADIQVAQVGYRMVCLVSDKLDFDLAEVLIAARMIVHTTNNTQPKQGASSCHSEESKLPRSNPQASLAPPSSH